MTTIQMSDVQSDPLGCVRRAAAGETLVVVEQNRAIVEIRPAAPLTTGPRPIGLAAGQFTLPEDFNASLPEDILRDFEGA
jgi:antitoxin (DNA-binding transcriptional repressor) of toxin-antitoxin stability system